MYKPLVSIMIPFHNAEQTLARCLDSVTALNYRPLEILLVDDASTDSSLSIAQEYIGKSATGNLKFKLISLDVNRGVAAARAMALSETSGEYITAVDADDYIEPEAIDVYVRASNSGEYDIVAAGVIYQYGAKDKHLNFSRQQQRLSLNEMYINSHYFLLTNKLIRVSAMRRVTPFTDGNNCWEDLNAIARMLASGASSVIVHEAYYHYVQTNQGSLTKSRTDYILSQHIAIARELEAWLSSHSLADKYDAFLTYLKFIAKVKCLRNYGAILRHPVRRLRMWRDTFPEVNSRISQLGKVPAFYRALFIAARIASSWC
ncbi:MAG: glycosyltransferase [Prevotella sp.]|nr:glycosyltransferase [Prevotella sp.]MCM1074276.1 glycosyltransferase [Ruminococcus sp.]